MKEIFFILLILILISGCGKEFCGSSTYSECDSNYGCMELGCSGEICGRVGEKKLTICEWKDCYSSDKYDLKCKCVESKCQWF